MTWAEVTHPDDLAADVASFSRVMVRPTVATPNDGPGATFAFTMPRWPPDARPGGAPAGALVLGISQFMQYHSWLFRPMIPSPRRSDRR